MKKLILTAALAIAALPAAIGQVNSPDNDGYRERGVLMYADKNYVGCIDQMGYLKQQSPTAEQLDDADYYIAMSAAHLGRNDAAGMLRFYLWRHPESPRCNLVRLTLADINVDAGRYDRALQIFDSIEPASLDVDSRATYCYGKAYCLLKQARYDEAARLYQAAAADPRYANGARFYQGYIAYVNKDYRKAAELLRNVDTSTEPGNMADFYLSQIYFLDRDYNRAASTGRRLLSRNDVAQSYRLEAARVAGESLYQLGNDAEAIPLLRQYVEGTQDPLPSTLYILGVADYRVGNYAEAVRELTPVASQDNAMGQSANLYIGQSMMQQGNYSSAMIAFEKAFNVDFDSDVKETAYYNYAVASTEGGRVPFGSTVSRFEQFLRSYPSSRYAPRIREYIVSGYMTDDNYPAALASINAIDHPSPKILAAKQQVLYTLGTRELAAGEVAKAADHLRQASRLTGYNDNIAAETKLWLGEAEYALGNYGEARKQYTAYLADKAASAENRPLAQYDLAYSQFAAKEYDDAAATFKHFADHPGTLSQQTVADAWNRIGDCRFVKSQFVPAVEAYDMAYAIYPATGDYPLFQNALIKGYQRDYTGKIATLRTLIDNFPSSALMPQSLLEIGESYAQLGEPERSVETYSMVAARYPSTSQGRRANLLLAQSYLNAGSRSQAVDTYKNLISQAPTSEEARQALEDLKQLMAEDGTLAQYNDFAATIPGAPRVEGSELERLTFESSESEYLAKGTSGRLHDYLTRFPDGEQRAEVLAYSVEAASKAGDTDAIVKYSSELITRYPDHSRVADALKSRAETYLAQGKGELALADFTMLEQKASTPVMVNEARMGVLRTARDLGLNDRVIEAADAITSSSTSAAAHLDEARFSRAMANSLSGNNEAAAAEWSELAANTDDIYGTKALFYLADMKYQAQDYAGARKDVEKLVGSNTPHIYWLARGFILLSDINRAEGNTFEADQYLISVRNNYPGTESDIFSMIEQRLNKNN